MGTESKAQIFVVDGQRDSRKEIVESVPKETYRISEFESVSEVRKALARETPKFVLAELKLPDCSGFSLCREMREGRNTRDVRIVLLSDWSSEMDRIFAFECGADDFVSRPFSRRELTSRLRALDRRPSNALNPGFGDSNSSQRHFIGANEPRVAPIAAGLAPRYSGLTAKEASILTALMGADGRPLSREELIERVWGHSIVPSARCIDSHVKSLRRKLRAEQGRIETVRGIGYRFSPRAGSYERRAEATS